MRAFTTILPFAAVAMLGFGPGLRAADEVRWQTDLQAARQLAAQTNRLVVLHFWAPWCGPCMKMEHTVFNQPGVGSALEADYVPVKLNFDENRPIAGQYGVKVLPTDVVITPQGEMVKRMQSPSLPSQYVARLGQVAADTRQMRPELYAAVPAAPRSVLTAPARDNQAAPPRGNPTAPARGADRYADASAGSRYGDYRAAPRPQEVAPQPRYANQAVTEWTASDEGQHDLVLQPPSNRPPDYRQPDNRQPIQTQPDPRQYSPQPDMARQSPRVEPSGTGYDAPNNARRPIGNRSPIAQDPRPVDRPPFGQVSVATTPEANPTRNAPLCMDGYCPVHLADKQQWVKGDPKWGVIHRGRTYLFTTKSCQQTFWANPDRFSPVLGGNDPVLAKEQGVNQPGRREFGVFYGSRVVLFASAASRQKFEQSPAKYVSP